MQYEIRCVATNPLEEKPQTAKLANSNQKSSERTPLARPANAVTNGLAVLVMMGGSAAAPYGPRPTLPGLSASISTTSGTSARITSATAQGTLCQPRRSAR